MFMLNNAPLPVDTPFEVNGVQYPQNWLRLSTLAEKEAIGITEVADPEPYDDRFYWGLNNPKDLDQLKAQWTQWVNDTTWQLLQKTDFMDSRKANDPSYVAPADWVTWRSAIRTQAANAKSAIASATDIPTLQAAIDVQWILNPLQTTERQQ